ncbi:MAG: MFS transporter [Bacillota bacterium]
MFSTVSIRNLWLFSLSDAMSRFGGQFQFLALITLIYSTTRSPLLTALMLTTGSLPIILLARWAGAVADRFDPRRVVAVANLVQAVLTLCFLLVDQVYAYLALTFVVTSVGVFQLTARSALLPQMVGRERILQANARLATVRGAVQLLAPGLAGTLVVLTGPEVAFVFNAASFLAPALAMLFITPVERVERPAALAANGGSGDVAWAFLRSRPDLVVVLLAFGAYEVGMWAVNALFIPYAGEILHGGADLVGWATSLYFGAGLLTGMLLERYGHVLRSHRLLYAAYFAGALVWVGYIMTRSIPVALILSAFDGIVYTYAWTLFESRVQEEAPPEARGRVFGLVRAGDEVCSVTGQVGGGLVATYGGILGGMGAFTGLTVLLLGLVGLGGRALHRPVLAKQVHPHADCHEGG